MSMASVRRFYGVPAKRGARVAISLRGKRLLGTIARATHYLYVRVDGERRSRPYHPYDVEFLD